MPIWTSKVFTASTLEPASNSSQIMVSSVSLGYPKLGATFSIIKRRLRT